MRKTSEKQQAVRQPRHLPTVPTARGNERIREIVVEARKQLLEKGVSGFSLRGVAVALDLRLFNVQHYFATTEALLRAALEDAIATFDAEISAFLNAQKTNGPKSALRESCRHFLRMNGRRAVRFFFFEMAAAAQRDCAIEDMLHNLYVEYLARIRALVQAANPSLMPRELDRRVELIASLIEGTMLVLPATKDEQHDLKSENARLDFLVDLACR